MGWFRQILKTFFAIAFLASVPAPARESFEFACADTSGEAYERLIEKLINPELRDEVQVLAWAMQYDSLFARLVDLEETQLNNEDLRLIRLIKDAKRIQALAAKLKPHRALAVPFDLLEQLAEQLVSHARIRAIQEIIGAQEMFHEEETESFSDELPAPEKQCAFCGEEVENGLIECPNCGSGNFSMK